jgi:hypothetical protein
LQIESRIGNPMRNPLLWALYLGMSWTWVIGMFLPVLLVRDFGPWGWVLFAIPNCVGAAAMGWVMRTAQQSEQLVATHAGACRLFTLVTISFHLFFAIWMLPQFIGIAGWVVAAVLVQAAFTPIHTRLGVWLAPVVLAASVAVWVMLWMNGWIHLPPRGDVTLRPVDAMGLGVVCVAGFVACPYLDLTFHRARQATSDAGAKIAFGVGFCVFFASMIVLTLLYASTFFGLTNITTAAILLAIHLSVQMTYTVNVHARSGFESAQQRDDVASYRAAIGAALALGMVGGVIAYFGQVEHVMYANRSLGELIYRGYLSFYGLLFPAYALTSLLGRRPKWLATLVIVAAALPFYWLGFIEQRMAWTSVGVAIVVVGGLLVSRPWAGREVRGFEPVAR